MNKKIVYLFLFLLIVGISLSPRFSFGALISGRSIDIRAEDIVLSLGLVAFFLYIFISDKYKFQLPPLFWPVIAWCGFGFFSVFTNALLGNISLNLMFLYFLKEIEFFLLYFIVFYCIISFNFNKKLVNNWLFFALLNILWLVYVFIFNVKWSIFYGPNAFAEPQGSFPSGGFFLMLFIFLFNFFLFYYSKLDISRNKKILLFILCAAPVLGVVSSGSTASTIGLFASVMVSSFLLFADKINFLVFVKITILFVIILGILFVVIYALPINKRIISFDKFKREYASNSPDSRGTLFKNHLSAVLKSPEILTMGIGVFGEAHSQYIRILLERGVIGLALFLWLMWSILKISYSGFKEKNDLLKRGLCAGLFACTIAMLVMSIPNDAFMVVKIDEVYWFFAAMAMASISISKKQKTNLIKFN